MSDKTMTPEQQELFADLARQFREGNGGNEVFYVIDSATIGCRYADLCIMQDINGWHYGPCPESYLTPSECYANHRKDLARFHSANDLSAPEPGAKIP